MKFCTLFAVVAWAGLVSSSYPTTNFLNGQLLLAKDLNLNAQEVTPITLLLAAASPTVQTVPVGLAQVKASGPIQAAIQSQRQVRVVEVENTGGQAERQSIVIGPTVQALDLEFQSKSSPLNVRQTHIPGTPNPPQFARYEEQPDLLRQEIVKPVIHEVTEAIQPVRRITQEVRPVQETITQVLHRAREQRAQLQAIRAARIIAQPITALAITGVASQPQVDLQRSSITLVATPDNKKSANENNYGIIRKK